MRNLINKLFSKIEAVKTKKKIAPFLAIFGFGLLVASTVLFILATLGLFLPAFDGIHFGTTFKLGGIGIFAILVGRKWLRLKTKSEKPKQLKESSKEILELEADEDVLELQQKLDKQILHHFKSKDEIQ